MGIVRIRRTSGLKRKPDRLHLIFLGIGDNPFDARFTVRLFFDKIVFLRKSDPVVCFILKKRGDIRAKALQDIHQSGNGR